MANILLDDSLTDHLTSITHGVWNTDDEVASIFLGGSAIVAGITRVSFSLNFSGTSLALFGHTVDDTSTPNSTINEVILDVCTVSNIFLPHSNTIDLWYQSPTLPDSDETHNITFGDFPTMLIDYALVSAGLETPLAGQTLLVDDTDMEIEYTGAWSRSSSIISGDNVTSRVPVGGSFYQTADDNASVTFRFSGTSISVYGVSPSEEGVVMEFGLDANITKSNPYNTTVFDPNFLWFSRDDLSSGNHTLTIGFSAQESKTQNFTMDYITYVPSFSTLSEKPNFNTSTNNSHSSPSPSAEKSHRRILIGAIVGPTAFAIILSLLVYWKRKHSAFVRKEIESQTAMPFNLPSRSASDSSIQSLVPQISGQSGDDGRLQPQHKPRYPGQILERESTNGGETVFPREIRKPRLPGREPRSITSHIDATRPLPLHEHHKTPLPGHEGVYNGQSGSPGRDLEWERQENGQYSRFLREIRKPRLPEQETLSISSSPHDTTRPSTLHEHHKSSLPVQEGTNRAFNGQSHSPNGAMGVERQVSGEDSPFLREIRKPRLPRGNDQSIPIEAMRPQTVQEQHKPRLHEDTARIPDRNVGEDPQEIRTSIFPERLPTHGPAGGRVPAGPQPIVTMREHVNSPAVLQVPHNIETAGQIRETHKPRLKVHADLKRPTASQRSVPSHTSVPQSSQIQESPDLGSPVSHSASEIVQSPTRSRLRWWPSRRSQYARAEPFMLVSPVSNGSEDHASPRIIDSPSSRGLQSVIGMGRVIKEEPVENNQRTETQGNRSGEVREMLEDANLRLAMLENADRMIGGRRQEGVMPPPYQPE